MKAETEITIVCNRPSERLKYIAGFLQDALGIRFDVSAETRGSFQIHYGPHKTLHGLQIYDSGFLHKKGVESFTPEIKKENGFIIFPSPPNYDIPFDLFSAIFYLISRYEEYLPFKADIHGRFDPQTSFQYTNDFLLYPVVDEWVGLLRKTLTSHYPKLVLPPRAYRFSSTIDIDSPWAFKYRNTGGNLPGLIKSLIRGDFSNAIYRSKVLSGRLADPYDVYSFIRNLEDEFSFSSLFFFLLRRNGSFDLNHSIGSKHFYKLVRDLSGKRETGIHPSYVSNSRMSMLKEEFRKFEEITGGSPVRSRQHFLILRFPDTYRKLISLGITDDYSMGYASLPGFRAGTTLPFYFYDLGKEQTTALKIHPFVVMDVTLQQYMKQSPEEAIKTVFGLINKIREVGGVFTLLWHNESLSEFGPWKGWRNVFREIIREATVTLKQSNP